MGAIQNDFWDTGIEIGKMAYGTGPIPFMRTSDISNWELKGDPKQNVSVEIYEENKQDVQPEDIFVVRDGTYLVGTSCILTEHDTRILYCGGIYKLRVNDKKKLDPYLLLALLNAPDRPPSDASQTVHSRHHRHLGQTPFRDCLAHPKGHQETPGHRRAKHAA